MSATLLFNLLLLVAVGGLLVWFPDRLTLVPLILSKVTPPGIESNARRDRDLRRDRTRPAVRAKRGPAKGKKPAKRQPRKKATA